MRDSNFDDDLRALIDNTLDALCTIESKYVVRFFNRRFADSFLDTFGTTLVVGSPILDFLSDELRGVWKQRLDRCFAGETVRSEDRFVVDGHQRFFETTYTPIRRNGGTTDAVGVYAREVTDQKMTEDEARRYSGRLHAVLDSATQLGGAIRNGAVIYQETLDRLAATFQFDTGTVQILEGDHLRVVASTGFAPDSRVTGMVFPLTETFPNYRVMSSGRLLALADVRTDFPHFQSESEMFDSGHIRSWLGIPLVDRGNVIGMITLDRRRYDPFESEDVQLAAGFADHAAVAITNARMYQELRDANANQQTLLRELHHRVKNNMQLVSSLISLRINVLREHEAVRILRDVRTHVDALASVHDSIYRSPSLELVDLPAYVGAVVADIESAFLSAKGDVGIVSRLEEGLQIDIDRAIPFGLLVCELLLNAIKHAFPDDRSGTITVDLSTRDHEVVLTVSDDGVGIRTETDDGAIGMELVRTLARQIDGTAELHRDQGTRWVVRVP